MERKKPQYTKCDIEMEKLKKGWIQKIIGSGDNSVVGFSCLIIITLFIGLLAAFMWGTESHQNTLIGLLQIGIGYAFGKHSENEN